MAELTHWRQMEAAQSSLIVRLDRGVAMSFIGAGVVTRETLARLGDQTAARLGRVRPLAFLADFRRPVLALTVAGLDAFFDDADPAVLAPAALVVSEAYLPMFRAHAWNVAQAGILRKVFTDYACAERWCRMRVQLHHQAQTAP